MKDTKPKPLLITGIGIIVLAILAAHYGGLFATTSSGITNVNMDYELAGAVCTMSGTASYRAETAGWHQIGACSGESGTYLCYAFSDPFYATGTGTTNLKDMTIVSGEMPPLGDEIDVTLLKSPYQTSDIIGFQKVLTITGCVSPTPTPESAPCAGLPECTSDSSIFHECCGGDVWSCMWCNYDTKGYRMQWNLWDTCDAICACDGSEVNQACWCSGEPTPTPTPTAPTPTPTPPPSTDCTSGETYPYTCPDGTTVTWCTCTAGGTWDCADIDDICTAAEDEDWWQTYAIFGGIAVFLSLLYFAYRKKGGK